MLNRRVIVRVDDGDRLPRAVAGHTAEGYLVHPVRRANFRGRVTLRAGGVQRGERPRPDILFIRRRQRGNGLDRRRGARNNRMCLHHGGKQMTRFERFKERLGGGAFSHKFLRNEKP